MPRPYRQAGSILLAALLVTGAAFSRRDTHYELRVQMSSSVSSQAQVFYDIGQGYREENSSTQAVVASANGHFQQLAFPLPTTTVYALRFDPLNAAGHFVIRDIEIRSRRGTVLRISPANVQSLNQIAQIYTQGNQVYATTVAGANDPGVRVVLSQPLLLKTLSRRDKWKTFVPVAAGLTMVALLSLAVYERLASLLSRLFAASKRWPDLVAARCSSLVLPLDSLAIWFYALCVLLFLTASLLKLNGSSISFYSVAYNHGAHVKPWMGSPRAIRSDEWGYHTPDVLSQALRSDRFAVWDSDLGPHSASLIGNVPVRDVSALFRPQFWGFFFLPLEYAFAFYWQSKALFLIAGVFTWLLFITGSSRWAIGGALWFFFSPCVQWSYSWPSALPEMIGLACFGTVLFCYLLVGRSRLALAAAAAGFTVCTIDFAMCAYVPHMIPVAWVNLAALVSWCFANRKLILARMTLTPRLMFLGASILTILLVGMVEYLQLQQALAAISTTVYPGKRVVSGGAFALWQLLSHFMQWTETEDHFPAVIGNLSEGSGFLWLAPFAIFCIPRLELSRTQCTMLIALSACFLALLAWITLPIPASVGHLFALDRVPAARATPALGLANVAVVVLCASRLRPLAATLRSFRMLLLAAGILGLSVVVFMQVNTKLNNFFSTAELLCVAAFAAFLIYTFIAGRQIPLLFALVIANVIYFGNINPIERGLTAVTKSSLFAFVQSHKGLLDGKWLVYSDSPVSTGFLASMGFQVYTGTRYCPDVDHFPLFRRNGMDTTILNRLGYLDAHPSQAGEASTVVLENLVVARWNVSPTSPVLKQIGIKYVAFDTIASPVVDKGLIPVSNGAVDGFRLYRLP